MAAALSAPLLHALPGLRLGSLDEVAGNRVAVEGMSWGPGPEGSQHLGIRKLELASLRFALGQLSVDVGRVTLHQLLLQLRVEPAGPRLIALEAANGELAAVHLHSPLADPLPPAGAAPETAPDGADSTLKAPPPHAWRLGPLAAAEGTIRAEIVDAHLMFDADVTVPIRQGEVEFGDVTIEHVGPDSRMGASPQGIYIDAPNGRSYLHRFPAGPVAGVTFEARDALLGPWVSRRGSLQLQAFGESLLTQVMAGPALGIPQQMRELLHRTALAGELQLGDGDVDAPGLQATLKGRGQGHNALRLHSGAVGRGFTAELPRLMLGPVVLAAAGLRMGCDDASGGLELQLTEEGGGPRFGLKLDRLTLSGLRVQWADAAGGSPTTMAV